jgi:hypothetical protein
MPNLGVSASLMIECKIRKFLATTKIKKIKESHTFWYSEALQYIPKLGFLVCKYTSWQPCVYLASPVIQRVVVNTYSMTNPTAKVSLGGGADCWHSPEQGCQMIYFHTNLGTFWTALEWIM